MQIIIIVSLVLFVGLMVWVIWNGKTIDRDIDIDKNKYDRMYNKYMKK